MHLPSLNFLQHFQTRAPFCVEEGAKRKKKTHKKKKKKRGKDEEEEKKGGLCDNVSIRVRTRTYYPEFLSSLFLYFLTITHCVYASSFCRSGTISEDPCAPQDGQLTATPRR